MTDKTETPETARELSDFLLDRGLKYSAQRVAALADALSAQEQRVAGLETLLRVAKCPDDDCEGKGWSAVQVAPGEWEQQQCQWCYERQALSLDAALAEQPPKDGI